MRTPASHCTWFPWCTEPVAHEVERHTADGVVLRELVCERHLAKARQHGFDVRDVNGGRGVRDEGRGHRSPRPS
jgi:hypothetical protein